ncbi:MAG: hypothetical protein ACOX0Z_02490 [Candidatus Nanosyncoccaceae bacterium]|jgi:hypothetical protein
MNLITPIALEQINDMESILLTAINQLLLANYVEGKKEIRLDFADVKKRFEELAKGKFTIEQVAMSDWIAHPSSAFKGSGWDVRIDPVGKLVADEDFKISFVFSSNIL